MFTTASIITPGIILCSSLTNRFFRNFNLHCSIMQRAPNPAGDRNKDPILDVLKRTLSKTEPQLRLLEISSGVGLHVAYFAQEFPNIMFQPSEFDTSLFRFIEEYRGGLKNVARPIFIDISKPCTEWENEAKINHTTCGNRFDYMLNINMLHISPIACAHGLFQNAAMMLKPGGLLITYGPYAVNGVLTPESNVRFNKSLQQHNPEWGIRDTKELSAIAESNGITLQK